ncbi:MAG TPA: thermonuclease family protein [Methylotenera sp.]|jgi:endonuclease YncB( thermonuclease family)
MNKILMAGLMLAFSVISHADLITGRVVSVTDGDTITILDNTNTQHKIRLAGIDAPEKNQAFGAASKKSLSDLDYGQQVTVEWNKHDRYGRRVGKVIVNGMDINLEQIKRGMAWFYKRYQNELSRQDRISYADAQDYAKQGRLGLWADSNPIPPWDFRKQNKNK